MYSYFKLIKRLESNNLPSRILQNDIEYTFEQETVTIFKQILAAVNQSKPETKGDFMHSIIISHEKVTVAFKASSRGTRLDRIPANILRYAVKQLSHHIEKLFQSILLRSKYLDRWKQSHVVPIFKGGPKNYVSC